MHLAVWRGESMSLALRSEVTEVDSTHGRTAVGNTADAARNHFLCCKLRPRALAR